MEPARYQVCEWHHHLEHEPVRVWSEIDADGWETRRLEIYRDGSVEIAATLGDLLFETGSSVLSGRPVPPIAEINGDPQLSAAPTTAAGFEAVWAEAMSEPALRARLSELYRMDRWVEMRAFVDLLLTPIARSPWWGEKNISVVFSFSEAEDRAVNLIVEFTTVGGANIDPGSTAQNAYARCFGPLWMTSVVVDGATFELEMGGVIGTGTVKRVVRGAVEPRPV